MSEKKKYRTFTPVHRVLVGQFKKRCAWRAEWETIEQARSEITAYIDRYHHRPHSGLAYRTPAEVATTWRDMTDLQTEAT
ncbi:MAG: integrase core domain-containing protein [Acidimicrobiales bacterium]|nr:integrase core domain-containing protein [Acidimicrobiales bacterium]